LEKDNIVCIMGMGYVGLTLGAVMANKGFQVHGVEIDPATLGVISQGKAHFYEVNLDALIRRGIKLGNLHFHSEIPTDIEFDVFLITVGTPLDSQGRPRMDMVEHVTDEICRTMRDGAMIVLRSTVLMGTSLNVVKPKLDKTGKSYHLCFCPERTVEGRALEELVALPQIVGGLNEESVERAMSMFRRLTPTIVRVSSLMAAELIKLLDNSFRDLFFAFGNEVALMCEAAGVDGQEIIRAANMGYPRTNIAKPGFVGGPCLEKDPHILMESLSPYGFVPALIQRGRSINESMVEYVYAAVSKALGDAKAPVVSLMGLAFKGHPDTDDLRGSLALHMIRLFRERRPDAHLRGQDYVCPDGMIRQAGLEPVNDVDAFRGADAVIVMNNNRRYVALDIEQRATLLNRPSIIYDCWNVFQANLDIPSTVTLHVFGK
jgi:UDP-N-acetyl-D-mannosaminuronic acid dehydrogenase